MRNTFFRLFFFCSWNDEAFVQTPSLFDNLKSVQYCSPRQFDFFKISYIILIALINIFEIFINLTTVEKLFYCNTLEFCYLMYNFLINKYDWFRVKIAVNYIIHLYLFLCFSRWRYFYMGVFECYKYIIWRE